MVARTATKDIGGAPQESIILGAAEAASLRAQAGIQPARFVVLIGPGFHEGDVIEVTAPTTVGRERGSGIQLDGDEFASSRHARIDLGLDGVSVEDLGSTNGTFVNGDRVTSKRLLKPGDVLRVGQTELQLER